MSKFVFIAVLSAVFLFVIFFQIGCTDEGKAKPKSQQEMIEMGKYIVHTSGCDDCHTPKIFTDKGPVFDTTKQLSGHPQGDVIPPLDVKALGINQWAATTMSLTAWVGPWGTTFAINLTPHPDGLGLWTEDQFVHAIRTGLHLGVGRPILPPMPWPAYAHMTDEDLRAIFAYLRTLPPVANVVPQPLPPRLATNTQSPEPAHP